MSRRLLVIGLAATAGVLASSCASTARDTLVDIYDDEATASDVSEPCRIEALTFETAIQAFVAQYGQPPTAESDLVPELVRESPENWRFDAGVATSFVPISGGRCDGYEVEPGDSPSIGQLAVDSIDDSRSASCAIDKRQIEAAVETHFAFNGFDATTLDELAMFGVEDEANRWILQIPADSTDQVPEVVPIVGGACDN